MGAAPRHVFRRDQAGHGGLGARRWEAAQRESFVRHQYGGVIGGRIKKDKMFFFGGVDVFSHTLGALLKARVPLPIALPLSLEASGSRALAAESPRLSAKAREGASLGEGAPSQRGRDQ